MWDFENFCFKTSNIYFHKDLGFILLFCVVIVLSAFSLSLACYDVVLFVVLLQHFIYVDAIQTEKTDLISQRY